MTKSRSLIFSWLIAVSCTVYSQESVWREHMEAGITALGRNDSNNAVIEFSIALVVAKKYYKDSTWLADNYGYLGIAHKSGNDLEQAEKNFLLGIDTADNVLGTNHVYTSALYNRLGNVYVAMGSVNKGLEFNKKAVTIHLNNNPVNELELAKARTGLASAYNALGRSSEAITEYQLALSVLETELGETHPEVSNLYHSIGQEHNKLGNHEAAESAHLECLRRRVSYYGPRHEEVGWTHNNLSHVYHDWGKYSESERAILTAIEIFEETVGADSQHMGTALNNLAALRLAQERHVESLELYEKSLVISTAHYGPNHPNTLITKSELERVRAITEQ